MKKLQETALGWPSMYGIEEGRSSISSKHLVKPGSSSLLSRSLWNSNFIPFTGYCRIY